MFELAHDLRSSIRGLLRRPAYPIVAVAILALGLSAGMAIGAERADISRLILSRALVSVTLGLALGLTLSHMLSGLVRGLTLRRRADRPVDPGDRNGCARRVRAVGGVPASPPRGDRRPDGLSAERVICGAHPSAPAPDHPCIGQEPEKQHKHRGGSASHYTSTPISTRHVLAAKTSETMKPMTVTTMPITDRQQEAETHQN